MDDRTVTEQDFRRPEFIHADPKDYERRRDGAIVRKDRWERAVHSIWDDLAGCRRDFETVDVVAAVRALVASIESPEDDPELEGD